MSRQSPIYIVGMGVVGQATARLLLRSGYEKIIGVDPIPPRKLRKWISAQYFRAISFTQQGIGTFHFDRGDIVIVCVPTPTTAEAEQDISIVQEVIDALRPTRATIILRSTVLPEYMATEFGRVDVAWPEFLRMAHIAADSDRPDYEIVGLNERRANQFPLVLAYRRAPRISYQGSLTQALAIKYLHNCWNALRIAFVNEVTAALSYMYVPFPASVVNAYFQHEPYLVPGGAFGGVCLPKDMQAFTHASPAHTFILRSALIANELHRQAQLPLELTAADQAVLATMEVTRDEINRMLHVSEEFFGVAAPNAQMLTVNEGTIL